MKAKKWYLITAICCVLSLCLFTGFLLYQPGDELPERPLVAEHEYPYEVTGAWGDDSMSTSFYTIAENETHAYSITKVHQRGEVYKSYQEGGVKYTMIAGQPEGKEDLYEDLIERNSNEPIYTESDDEGWVIVRVEESYPGDVGSENLANTLVQSLQLPGIERVGTKGDEIVVYEPVNQWAGQYRFTDAEGSIATDSDSDVVREASVTYTQTEATTYFEYVTGDREKRAYEYEYTPDADVNLETPTWVEACIYDDDCEAVR